MKKVAILFLLFMSCSAVSGLTCYSCYDVLHPRFCDKIKVCEENEICGMEKVIKSQEVTYNIGCVSKMTCSQKRSLTDLQTCKHCCDTDLCNINGCGEHGYLVQSGPVCYICQGTTAINECNHVNICEDNEICYIEKKRFGGEEVHTTGCRDKHLCYNKDGLGSIFGKKRDHNVNGLKVRSTTICTKCCETSLCNSHCGDTNTTTNPATLPTTPQHLVTRMSTAITVPTTNQPCEDHTSCSYLVTTLKVCNDSHGKHLCPLSCGVCSTPPSQDCVDTETECEFLKTTYGICADPLTARKSGCLKTCNYCGICNTSNPCKNGGTCQKTKDWFVCHCKFGFEGDMCADQTADSSGKEFLFAFLESYSKVGHADLYIVSKSNGACNVYIPSLSINTSLTVSSRKINSYRMNANIALDSNGIQHKLIYIECDVNVSVFGVNFVEREYDGFLVLPTRFLGKDYYTANFKIIAHDDVNKNCNFGIVSYLSISNITIDFRMTGGKIYFNNRAYTNGSKMQLILRRFDTFYLSHNYDLSGTHIQSNAPIAVLSGVRTSVLRNGYGNHMSEMMLPINQYGKDFVVPTLFDSQCNFRIFSVRKTSCTMKNGHSLSNISINANDFNEYENYTVASISANNPISIQLYCNGLSVSYDSFMVTLPSIQHFKTHYQFPVVNDFLEYRDKSRFFITVIIASHGIDGLRLDTSNMPTINSISNITLTNKLYSVLSVSLNEGLHEIEQVNDIRFGLLVYGRTPVGAYGYPGGFAFKQP